MRSGIYRIINSVNGNIYIGSSVDLIRRRKQHFIALLNNKHFNNHLQSAYNKYGECNFEFEVIEDIDFCEDLQEKLLEREQYYLDLLNVDMLIIDEIHNILSGSIAKQKQVLNAIKNLSNHLKIPIVLSGTKDALRAVSTDTQISSRFRPIYLKKWKMDKEF